MPSPDPIAPEDAAWAEVLEAWQDEARHRAYLARCSDLEGLAAAGRRYREVLAARPGDAMAARFRDDIVKRALVQGLASIPRAAPPREAPRNLVRALAFVGAMVLAAAGLYMLSRLGTFAGAKP